MKISIVVSKLDNAGLNIKQNLIEHHNFKKINEKYHNNDVYENEHLDVKLYTLNCSTIDSETIDQEIETDLFLYATKHASVSGKPSLSVHSPGNWHIAELGGEDDKLCIAPQNFVKESLIRLQNNKDKYSILEDFEVVQECTHHGPHIDKPIFFIEIGATEKEWIIPEAGKLLAEVIISLIEDKIKIKNMEYISVFGIGGLHTLPNFKEIIFNSEYAIAHECPKYMLEHLTKDKIIQALKRTTKESKLVILDWKGMGVYKEQIKNEIDLAQQEIDFEVKKLKTIKNEIRSQNN